MNLNRDFQEFVELFVAHEVEFLVVGGYALAAHGNRVYVTLGDVKVPFLSPEDLRTNKLAAGRPRDIADVADLSSPE